MINTNRTAVRVGWVWMAVCLLFPASCADSSRPPEHRESSAPARPAPDSGQEAAAPEFRGQQDVDKPNQAIHEIQHIVKTVELFYLANDRLPGSLTEISDQLKGGEVPRDPWGNDYVYEVKSKREYDVISLGADGARGGEGFDQDINRTFKRRQKKE